MSAHSHIETHDVAGALEKLASLPAMMHLFGTLAGLDADHMPTLDIREEEQGIALSIELSSVEADALLTYVEEHIAQQQDINLAVP